LNDVYDHLLRYFEEKLGASASRLPEVNLHKIARDGDETNIVQLCKYVLTATAHSPETRKKISLQKPIIQNRLMNFIDEVRNTESYSLAKTSLLDYAT
jgi:predicted HAD superfamily hydrolase